MPDSPPIPDLLAPGVWDMARVHAAWSADASETTRRTIERRVQALPWLPPRLDARDLRDEAGQAPTVAVLDWDIERARSRREWVLFVQLAPHPVQAGAWVLHANDARGARLWLALDADVPQPGATTEDEADADEDAARVARGLQALAAHAGKPLALFAHGELVRHARLLQATLPALRLIAYAPVLPPTQALASPRRKDAAGAGEASRGLGAHLRRLEAQSIHIIREAVAEARNPVMLYSIGKDSSVMLHLARKAFHPGTPPMQLLHVDTRWKFREMYLMRERMARESGMPLIVHINPQAIERDINPFDHGSALHTDITKTEGLKQALDAHRFDVVFGGARRDEEKSRAKERVFSFRTATHRWDPRNQRPELWNLFNTRKGPGESIRVFPLSDWTELDIWLYIHQENIPVVPLYFARERPVVVRDNFIMMVDDDRMRFMPGERIQARRVRFRTLGCYPLSGAIESSATSVEDIILELVGASSSERQGRAIDSDGAASMERKKQEGYF